MKTGVFVGPITGKKWTCRSVKGPRRRRGAPAGNHCEAQDALIKQVLSTPALTPKGKQEKFFVLLNCIMPDEWREDDERADCDVKQAVTL
jgi:hypothetical protein